MYVNLLFWFQFFCGFSGSTMSNSWVLIFFNLLFTSAPPLIYGVLDKDVSVDTLLSLPQLYKAGQNSQVGKYPVILYILLVQSMCFLCIMDSHMLHLFFALQYCRLVICYFSFLIEKLFFISRTATHWCFFVTALFLSVKMYNLPLHSSGFCSVVHLVCREVICYFFRLK